MISIPILATPELARVQAPLLLLAMLGVSLLLIFAGRTLAKVLAFVVVGLVGAAFGGTLAAQFLSPGWSIVGAVLGFVIGGLLGVTLMILGIGLAAGYAGYLLALELALNPTAAIVFGFIAFILGLVLANKFLALGTAIVGGFLLFNTLALIGLGPSISIVVAAVTTLIGIWVQWGQRKRMTQPTAPRVGGQPSDHR